MFNRIKDRVLLREKFKSETGKNWQTNKDEISDDYAIYLESKVLDNQTNIDQIIQQVRKFNPYSADMFPEVSKDRILEIINMLTQKGIALDLLFTDWGRMVWKECISLVEKAINNNID